MQKTPFWSGFVDTEDDCLLTVVFTKEEVIASSKYKIMKVICILLTLQLGMGMAFGVAHNGRGERPSPVATPRMLKRQKPLLAEDQKRERVVEYETEVDAAIRLVERNYAGFADKRTRFGAKIIDGAAAQARKRAAQATTEDECDRILFDYVSVFQDGHLSAVRLNENGQGGINLKRVFGQKDAPGGKPKSSEPSAQALSASTFLVTIPNFDLSYKASIDALIKTHEADIKNHPNLILDVRGNGGGSDDSYTALRPYLYTQPIKNIGADVLATRANADAWEDLLPQIPPGETEIIEYLKDIVKRMRAAPEGKFITSNEDSTDKFPLVIPRPDKIAILIDRDCASTTEQFLLEARQSKKVTFYGQTTEGVLDYANVRTFRLPSGKRILGIATTRSRRLPKNPVDNIGIKPDVFISNLTKPQTADDTAVAFVQAALERKAR